MEVIVLSTPGEWSGGTAARGGTTAQEVALINELFDRGLERFHLRKPRYSVSELRRFLDRIKPENRNKVVIHSFHDLALEYDLGGIHLSERQRKLHPQSRQQAEFLLEKCPQLKLSSSFHSLSDLRFAPRLYTYTFISPVFDSISKPHHLAAYREDELVDAVAHATNKVIALGGISIDRIPHTAQMGFDGVGLLGAVWKSSDPIRDFQAILAAAKEPGGMAASA